MAIRAFFESKMFKSEVLHLSEKIYICQNKVIFETVITQIFDQKNCNKYLEKKVCRYYAKRLEKQEGGLSEI